MAFCEGFEQASDERITYLMKKHERVTSSSSGAPAYLETLVSEARKIIFEHELYYDALPDAVGEKFRWSFVNGAWDKEEYGVGSSVVADDTSEALAAAHGIPSDLWDAMRDGECESVETDSQPFTVVRVNYLRLAHVPGTLYRSPSYHHDSFRDAIPFLYDVSRFPGSVSRNKGTTLAPDWEEIPNPSVGEWVVQEDSGVLQFFDSLYEYPLDGVTVPLFSEASALPDKNACWFDDGTLALEVHRLPHVSFWRYCGDKGLGALKSKIAELETSGSGSADYGPPGVSLSAAPDVTSSSIKFTFSAGSTFQSPLGIGSFVYPEISSLKIKLSEGGSERLITVTDSPEDLEEITLRAEGSATETRSGSALDVFGILPAVPYQVTLSFRNALGEGDPYVGAHSTLTPGAPSAPQNLSLSISGTNVRVTFSAPQYTDSLNPGSAQPGGDRYRIYYTEVDTLADLTSAPPLRSDSYVEIAYSGTVQHDLDIYDGTLRPGTLVEVYAVAKNVVIPDYGSPSSSSRIYTDVDLTVLDHGNDDALGSAMSTVRSGSYYSLQGDVTAAGTLTTTSWTADHHGLRANYEPHPAGRCASFSITDGDPATAETTWDAITVTTATSGNAVITLSDLADVNFSYNAGFFKDCSLHLAVSGLTASKEEYLVSLAQTLHQTGTWTSDGNSVTHSPSPADFPGASVHYQFYVDDVTTPPDLHTITEVGTRTGEVTYVSGIPTLKRQSAVLQSTLRATWSNPGRYWLPAVVLSSGYNSSIDAIIVAHSDDLHQDGALVVRAEALPQLDTYADVTLVYNASSVSSLAASTTVSLTAFNSAGSNEKSFNFTDWRVDGASLKHDHVDNNITTGSYGQRLFMNAPFSFLDPSGLAAYDAHASSLTEGNFTSELALYNGGYSNSDTWRKDWSAEGLDMGAGVAYPDYSGASQTRWAVFKYTGKDTVEMSHVRIQFSSVSGQSDEKEVFYKIEDTTGSGASTAWLDPTRDNEDDSIILLNGATDGTPTKVTSPASTSTTYHSRINNASNQIFYVAVGIPASSSFTFAGVQVTVQ